MSCITKDKQKDLSVIGMTVADKVARYFTDPAHRKDFERWYRQTYGQNYEWKKVSL